MITTTTGAPGHEMKGMKEVAGLEIPAHGELVLQPGGAHLMLMQLQAHPRPEERVELKLYFEPNHEELTLQLPAHINQ